MGYGQYRLLVSIYAIGHTTTVPVEPFWAGSRRQAMRVFGALLWSQQGGRAQRNGSATPGLEPKAKR